MTSSCSVVAVAPCRWSLIKALLLLQATWGKSKVGEKAMHEAVQAEEAKKAAEEREANKAEGGEEEGEGDYGEGDDDYMGGEGEGEEEPEDHEHDEL